MSDYVPQLVFMKRNNQCGVVPLRRPFRMGSPGIGEIDIHRYSIAYPVNTIKVVIIGLVARMHKTYIFRSNDQRYIILNGSPLMAGIDHHTDLLIAGWKWKSLNIVCNPIQMGDVIVNRFRFPLQVLFWLAKKIGGRILRYFR